MNKKKILILRFSSIGDIVLTTPVVRCLHQQLDAEVHYCTKKGFKNILEENPHVAKVHTFDSTLSTLIKVLRAEKFDYIIDLHNNFRTRLIKLALRKKSFSFDKLNYKKWLLVNLKVNTMPNIHIVDRYMATVKSLGVTNDDAGLDYFIPEKDEIELDWLPEPHQKGYIAFAIGGQHATKQLPLKRIIEVCDKINKPIVLLGGKEDKAVGEEVERFFDRSQDSEELTEGLRKLNKKAVIFNGCGKFNLNQSASLLKHAMAVFTHDTGLMHMAAALKKEVFSIWGNTVPEFGMYPYNTKFTIFEKKGLSCRPCSKIGHDKCPKGHFKCMNEIVFDFYIP